MDPFTPNDPVWKLLGKARPVEPRPNFTQNVLRAARNTPQERGWWPSFRASAGTWLASMQRPALVATAAAVVATLAAIWFEQPSSTHATAPVLAQSQAQSQGAAQMVADDDLALIANDVNIPLDGVNHMDVLVAMDDTSALTDSEIAFLLY